MLCMCVCMYACVYICMVCLYVCMLCMYVMFVCVCMCIMYVCYVCMYACVYICMLCLYVCYVCMCVYVCMLCFMYVCSINVRRSEDGKILTENEDFQRRWKEYFESILTSNSDETDSTTVYTAENEDIQPSYEKVTHVIQCLKNTRQQEQIK